MSRLYLSNPCAFCCNFCTRCCGRSRRPAFPAPSHLEARMVWQAPGRFVPRDCGLLFFENCICRFLVIASQRVRAKRGPKTGSAKQFMAPLAGSWIASSLSLLAMTAERPRASLARITRYAGRLIAALLAHLPPIIGGPILRDINAALAAFRI